MNLSCNPFMKIGEAKREQLASVCLADPMVLLLSPSRKAQTQVAHMHQMRKDQHNEDHRPVRGSHTPVP
jgi:hypothetical protein